MSKQENNGGPGQHTATGLVAGLITSLRLEITSVQVCKTASGDRTNIFYQGLIEFPSDDSRRGVTGLFRRTEVTGRFTQAAWEQLQSFHDRLCTKDEQVRGSVEIVANRAVLLQPRAWVTQTRLGVAAATVLKIRVEQIENARIPGHRWRALNRSFQDFQIASVKDAPELPFDISAATCHRTPLH